MKRLIPVFLLVVPAVTMAFILKKDKMFAPDVVRKYTSTPVANPVTVKMSKGMEYTITATGNGPLAKNGDNVSMLYTGKFLDGTVFDATSNRGDQPFTFKLGKHQVIQGWDSIVAKLHGGDKATMRIPAEYAYGAQQRGAIPANSTLIFEVEVLDIIAPPTQWVVTKKMDTITTASGLKIVMFKSATKKEIKKNLAPKPAVGETVTVHYSGFNLDGTMFDSSVERNQPFSFMLGKGQVIKGWDEGIGMLRKGEKAKLIIPYNLAYGESGRPPVIQPKATLIFDVELIDIK